MVEGPTSAQARLRLFGQPESAVRVTLYRDHHAWCPYCQKVWLWLEERRVPYRIRKVTMHCYGEKEPWYRQLVPSGMLPALELDGRLIIESDRILEALEAAFAPLGVGMADPRVLPLRQLERLLFRAWCQWLCVPAATAAAEERAMTLFDQVAARLDRALQASDGPFLLAPAEAGSADGFSTADLVFIPYVERMQASLRYYKGYNLRGRHGTIDRWFEALERRPTYLGTQGDAHTHAHDLPPQMGGCYASGTEPQRQQAALIDSGPWCEPGPAGAAAEALARVVRHHRTLVAVNPDEDSRFERALRCALTRLIEGRACAPPVGSAAGLRYLRDRISVPRDMGLHAARRLRQALEDTASLDGPAQGPPLPSQHRRDQNPAPFLA
ncbi:MAG: glutathione S-transferase [Prochlorococcaceae cyanobacterium]